MTKEEKLQVLDEVNETLRKLQGQNDPKDHENYISFTLSYQSKPDEKYCITGTHCGSGKWLNSIAFYLSNLH